MVARNGLGHDILAIHPKSGVFRPKVFALPCQK